MRTICLCCGKKITKTPRSVRLAKHGVFCNRECKHKWYSEYRKKKVEDKMKKAIVKTNSRVVCPYCGENRSLMMLVSSGENKAFHVDYAHPGDTVYCVSCKKEFER
jgi:hypothetical protein